VCLSLLIFLCTIKSKSSLLAPAYLGGPRKRAVKRLCACACACACEECVVEWSVVFNASETWPLTLADRRQKEIRSHGNVDLEKDAEN